MFDKFLKAHLVVLILFLQSGCENWSGLGLSQKILFVGNSYTNSGTPFSFVELARSGGHKVEIGLGAAKGGSFAAYVESIAVGETIQSKKWDYVILQEQSQIPANSQLRISEMYPAARELVKQVRAIGSKPVFFQTSGNRNGWPEAGLPGYENMQLEIIQGYAAIGKELHVPIAPVGHAWYVAMEHVAQFNPWVDDRHPNDQGNYLAACVFYATLYRESPEGLGYTGNLPKALANELQKIAADTVLPDPGKWNLE